MTRSPSGVLVHFGFLAIASTAAAWFYWSSIRARGRALVAITATFLWGAVVGRTVFVLITNASGFFQLMLMRLETQAQLVVIELALLAYVIIRGRAGRGTPRADVEERPISPPSS